MTARRPAVIGPFGPPQLACLRSWRDPIFVHLTTRALPRWLRPVPRYLALPEENLETPEGLAELAEFLRVGGASGLLCVAERLALWLHQVAVSLPCPLWVPSEAALTALMSKVEQLAVARRSGFALLPTYTVAGPEDIPDSGYPFAVRPDTVAGNTVPLKVARVDSAADFRSLYGRLAPLKAPLVAQPFRSVPNLVVHARRGVGGDVRLASFLVPWKFEGVTLAIRPAPLSEGIAASCRRFLDELAYVGVGHFEFLEDRGSCWFLEFNGRLGGTTAKVQRLGFDEPREVLAAFGVSPAPPSHVASATTSNVRALLRNALTVCRGKSSPFDYPNAGPLRSISRTIYGLVAWREETWSWRSPLLSMRFTLGNLRRE